MITIDWFEKWAGYASDKVAVTQFETGQSLTYGQLNNLGGHVCRHFKDEYQLTKGDRVGILAENCLQYIILLAAAQKSGIILVPLNYRLTPREIDFLVGDCEPVLLIVEDKFVDKLTGSPATAKVPYQLSLSDFAAFTDELDLTQTPDYTPIELSGDDTVLILYTSGTTAFPKGSIYTHRMMFWNSINTQLRLDVTSADRSVNMAPPFHTGNWNVLLTPFLHHSAFTVIMKNFDAEALLEAIDRYELTIVWAVPTMLKMVADADGFEQADLSRVRYIVVGGEAMPIALIQRWHDRGVPIRQGYGLTEVGPNVTSLNHQDAIQKAGSIGKPNFYYQWKLVDEQGNTQPANEPGELLLKGPNVMPGYWRNPEATAEAIVDGWFHTGDIMRCDEDGFLFVIDRIKNMYISGAENVYPAEVEYLLRTHPSLEAVAIIGVPDEKWGESGMAFVVAKPEKSLSSEDITGFCQGKLARYKIPKYVMNLQELPKNDAGKIDRKKLKELSREFFKSNQH